MILGEGYGEQRANDLLAATWPGVDEVGQIVAFWRDELGKRLDPIVVRGHLQGMRDWDRGFWDSREKQSE